MLARRLFRLTSVLALFHLFGLAGCTAAPPPQEATELDNYVADSARCRELARRKQSVKIPIGSFGGSQTRLDIPLGEDTDLYDQCMLVAGHPEKAPEDK